MRSYRPARVRSRASRIGLTVIVAAFAFVLGAAPVLARPAFTPSLVLSDSNMRDYQSMSSADIQRFLNGKPGPLKRMSFPRHDGGSVAPASVIIWEACQAWHINPKVMLVMLQKEQSLITRRKLAKQTLNRAVGAGCPDTGGNRYPGFGNQIWNGARLLDGYGEEGKTTEYVPHPWTPGLANKFTRRVVTSDLATYKLYVYNPSIGAKWPYGDLSKQSCAGNANFWKIWWSYWGDPLAETPQRPPFAPAGSEPTTISLTAQYSKVLLGQAAGVSGSLVSSASVTGEHVRLQTFDGSSWSTVPGAECAVDASGTFSFSLPAQHLERVRVVYDGAATLAPAVSGCFVSEVVPVVGSPRISGRSAKRPIRMSGVIAPAHSSTAKVYVYRVKKGKRSLYRTLTVKTNANGTWALKTKLPKGTWSVRALHNDAGHAGAYSAWVSLKVR